MRFFVEEDEFSLEEVEELKQDLLLNYNKVLVLSEITPQYAVFIIKDLIVEDFVKDQILN